VHFDAIVIGAGAMGSAAGYHLSRLLDGSVLTLEQHEAGHTLGSSHGPSRIFRMTYAHQAYVQLAQQAKLAWEQLERDAEEMLLLRTGDLFFGPPDGPLSAYIDGLEAAGCPFERLDAREASARWGCFDIPDNALCLHQAEGGVLSADRCIAAQLRLAQARGMTLQTGERVTQIDRDGPTVSVQTDRGRYQTERLIVTAGGWLPGLFPELNLPLRVTRQAVAYFQPEQADPFRPDRMPAWVFVGPGPVDATVYYGLPIHGRFGVKVARHLTDTPDVHPDTVDRTLDESDFVDVREFLTTHIPDLGSAPMIDPHVCLYSMLPDEQFLLTHHPSDTRILIASPCSGHGFKFSTLIGQILAELAITGRSSVQPFEQYRGLFATI